MAILYNNKSKNIQEDSETTINSILNFFVDFEVQACHLPLDGYDKLVWAFSLSIVGNSDNFFMKKLWSHDLNPRQLDL